MPLQEESSREEENPPDVPDVAPESGQSPAPEPDVRENTWDTEERPESEVKLRFKGVR